ncbi:MAG: hypothetical protein WCK52_09105 [Betaproteobacteria bacterium]
MRKLNLCSLAHLSGLKNNPNNIVGGDLLTYRQAALNEIIARPVLLQDAKKL